jgi:putative spermidine/putrescine transport system permease protein
MLYGLFTLPMIVPLVIIAVAVYALFLKLGLTGTTFAFVVSHVIVALPFTIISIINSLKLFDQSIEDAAVICGASRLQAIFKVTFPGIRPGMVAGGLFAFLVSWDEVVLSVMMASPTLQTLPVKMWTTLRQDLTPVIAVASTLLIALSVLVMVIAAALRRRSETTSRSAT